MEHELLIDRLSIIDFNVRLPLAGYERTMMYMRPERTRRRIEALDFASPATVLSDISLVNAERELEQAGIDTVVLPGRLGSSRFGAAENDKLVAYAESKPGKVWILLAVDPAAEDWKQHLEQTQARHAVVRGVIVEPGLLNPPLYADADACLPLYEHCEKQGIPVALAAGGNSEPDCGYSLPIYFDRVARDFPKLKLVIVHGGWPWVLPAIHVAQRHENVYLMPDAYLLMPGAEPYHVAMARHLKHRFIYGSAYPFIPPGQAIDRLRGMLNDDAAERFFHANAKQLLSI
jgi:predicted TIM-barrel fold metal-dependent hydrolase